MQLYRQLLIFLMLPLVLPYFPAALRLGAFAVVFSLTAWQLFQDYRRWQSDSDFNPPWLFFSALWLAVILLEKSTFSAGVTHRVWPSAAIGMAALYGLHRLHIPLSQGVMAFGAILWVMLLLSPHTPALLPDEHFYYQYVQSLPPVLAEGETAPALQPRRNAAILTPKSLAFETVFHAGLVCLTACIFYFAFLTGRGWRSWLTSAALGFCCVLLLLLAGQSSLILIGVNALLFLLIGSGWHWLKNWKTASALFLIAALFTLGYFVKAPLIFYRLVSPEPLLAYFDRPVASLELFGLLAEGYFRYAYYSWQTLIIGLAIPALVLYQALRQGRALWHDRLPDSSNAARLAFACSLLLFTAAFSLDIQTPTILTFLAHPFTWVGSVVLLNRFADDTAPQAATVSFYYSPHIAGLLLGIIALFTLSNTVDEERADYYLKRSIKAETLPKQFRAADQAFAWGHYRGDCAVVFVTTKLQQLAQSQQLPDEAALRKIDAAFYVSSRSGYVPLLAYQKLSDIYIANGQRHEAAQVLRVAAQRNPRVLILWELLADRLAALNQHNEAISAYWHCINLDPSAPRLRRKLADVYRTLGRMEDYRRLQRALLSLQPDAKEL